MAEKIKVTICTGTTCFVMGGSDILLLEEHLSEQWKDKVIIEGSPCLDYCNIPDQGKAPFVKIDNKILSGANIPAILSHIEKLLTER